MTGSPLTETTDSVIASEQAPDERPPTIELGLVVTPVLDAEAVQDLGQSVALELKRRFSGRELGTSVQCTKRWSRPRYCQRDLGCSARSRLAAPCPR
jgi:hypothetical protein